MGRCTFWYCIPKEIPHDPSKDYCFDYECQKGDDDMFKVKSDIYEKVYRCSPYNGEETRETVKKQLYDLCSHIWDETLHDKWCPRCLMFVYGINNKLTLIEESKIWNKRYSNPYWFSDWCIFKLLYGHYDTPFLRQMLPDSMDREILESDIHDVEQQINYLNEKCPPIHDIDKEAMEDSQRMISDCKHWFSKGYRVMYCRDS